jgi:HAD superfamily hydrolase (TIGR01549 family)
VWKHFGTELDPRTVIHAWLSTQAVIDATNAGYRAIWSVDGKYYLDALDEPWTSFYDVDILAGMTNTSAIPLVLGGETEMWGETADGSDVLQTIWPRAAAAAERQWSYAVVTNSKAPGVADRLQEAASLGLRIAIASSSPRVWINSWMDQLGLHDHFHHISTVDDTGKVKPDPSLFLHAAEKLGVAPEEAVIFEDSLNGLRAAMAAGIRCIVAPGPMTQHLDFTGAWKRVDSLAHVSLKELMA